MRVVCVVLLFLLCCLYTDAYKVVPVSGLSIAGRHARVWYETIQQLRADGYTHFAMPEATIMPWFVKGELVASKKPLTSVVWAGYRVEKVVL